MKLKTLLITTLGVLSITGCIAPMQNYHFDSHSLSPQIYNKFWAMEPQDNVANVLKITPDGNATLYRYSCDKLNNYKTKNQGNLGQLIEKLANDADRKNPGSGDLVREFIKIERYKLETIGQNEIKLHAIVIGGWSSVKFTSVSAKNLRAVQIFFGGAGGARELKYTNVHTPSFPICQP